MSTFKLPDRLSKFSSRISIVDDFGEYTYEQLEIRSRFIASNLLNNTMDLKEKRVAFIIPSSFDYVAVKLGIWLAGGISVPLCVTHPERELDYVISDSQSEVVIYHKDYLNNIDALMKSNNVKFVEIGELLEKNEKVLPDVFDERRAMILYTSGTTSKPKGVVSTHKNIESQIISLVGAWKWSMDDYILNVLPLHHLHGILNILLCSLWTGAKCKLKSRFDAQYVWNSFINDDLTIFMGVPTIYSKLIDYWEKSGEADRNIMSRSCSKFRLMVSGSASLPVNILEKWKNISGHILLERYGMTEVGMALSNSYSGERFPGYVGYPLPGVNVEIFDDDNEIVNFDVQGEIRIKGDNVFLEYWNKPQYTKDSFYNGWFKTGDIAIRNDRGVYKILGRSSVDIIKSGGYKISAIEIEEILREFPGIKECAVVGIEDKTWGEKIGAVVVLKSDNIFNINQLREWAKDKIANYKLPTLLRVENSLPRNVMGKVDKIKVKELFK